MNDWTPEENKVLPEALLHTLQRRVSFQEVESFGDRRDTFQVRGACPGALGGQGPLQHLRCRLPVVSPRLLQGRAPPPGGKAELHSYQQHAPQSSRVSSRCASPVLEGGVCASVLQQEADDLGVTFSGGHVQSRPSVVVHGLHVHPRQEVPGTKTRSLTPSSAALERWCRELRRG